jgi:ABC-type sugar transport system substrate-binding protein
MAHDAFISYSSKDKAIADAVCAKLENNQIRCWIAPRDILPGVEYGQAIVNALKMSRVVVLVLSSTSNVSPQVMREIERAVSHGIPIVPLRVENILPSESMEYYLSSVHWLDAITPPIEEHLDKLVDTVVRLLGGASVDKKIDELPQPQAGALPTLPKSTEPGSKKKILPISLIALASVLAVIAFVIWGVPLLKTWLAPALLDAATAAPIPATQAALPVAPATAVPSATSSGYVYPSQAACAPNCTYKDMTLCYPQLGAESDWRTANTASFKETAAKLGVKLIFSDAQQKQENQISALRSCIQQGVNVIALPPVVETGWDAVLQEAKTAGIPVIVVDRSVSADGSMYAAHIGSDMVIEGERSAAEFNKLLPNGGNILELSGTTGSGAAVGRAKGFRAKLNANIKILDSQTGNFTRAEGKPVMEAFLKKYAGQIQGVFFHNDDMAIGAVEAIKAAGIKPGDLKMVSIDGTRGGFQLMIDGWLQADVECNPLLGPQVMDLALKLMNGQAIAHEALTDETVYYPDKAAELLPTRKY